MALGIYGTEGIKITKRKLGMPRMPQMPLV